MAVNKELRGRVWQVRDTTRSLSRTWPLAYEDPLAWQATLDDQQGHARLYVVSGDLPMNQLDFITGPDDDLSFFMARYRYAASGILSTVIRTNFTTDEIFDNISGIDERLAMQQADPHIPNLQDYEGLAHILSQAPTEPSQG